MKFAVLGYENTRNIGDSIQTVAVMQHVSSDCIIINRDRLNEYSGAPCVVVMNGWFSHIPQNWPPSDAVTPIFFGFHMTPDAAIEYSKHKNYFKKFEPIGCRDFGTAEIVKSWGVEAYVSGCATMTFPERAVDPVVGRTLLVDVDRRIFRSEDRRDFISLTQESHVDYADDDLRNELAKSLLSYYKKNASAVVTSRIHCAIPCHAMGIPVLYCGVDEYRTKIIEYIGIRKISPPKIGRIPVRALDFKRVCYDEKKILMATNLRQLLTAHNVPLKAWSAKEVLET